MTTLVGYLNDLYAEARFPPLREVADASDGQLSYTSVHNLLFVDPVGCRLRTVIAVTRVLGGDTERSIRLWQDAKADRMFGNDTTGRRPTRSVTAADTIVVIAEDVANLTAAVDDMHRDVKALTTYIMGDRETPM